jgi:hypothetical protein
LTTVSPKPSDSIERRVETSYKAGLETRATREKEKEGSREGADEANRTQEGFERQGKAVRKDRPEAPGPTERSAKRIPSREGGSELQTAIPAVSISTTSSSSTLPTILPSLLNSASNKSFMSTEFDSKLLVPNFNILTTQALPQRIIKILNKGYKYVPEMPSDPKELEF